MKKSIFFIFCIFFGFTSCKIIKLTSDENLIMLPGKEIEFQFDGNSMFIDGTIDNNPTSFLFDTGASNFVIFDTLLIPNYHRKEKIRLFQGKGGDNRKVSISHVPVNLETSGFIFENCLASTIITESYACSNYKMPAIIGSSFLKKDTLKIIAINFDESKITFPDEDYLNDIGNYEAIKSKFFKNHFCIYLTINNVEEPFLFDTGNSFISLLLSPQSKIKLGEGTEFYGNEAISASGKINSDTTKYIDSLPVTINNYDTRSSAAQSKLNDNWYNNMGIGYIKKFNWLIDYKNETVYLSKSHFFNEYQNQTPKYSYRVIVSNGKLVIFSKRKNAGQYDIGDEITAIDNQKVTSQNICEMQSLLNTVTDWTSLNIAVKTNSEKPIN